MPCPCIYLYLYLHNCIHMSMRMLLQMAVQSTKHRLMHRVRCLHARRCTGSESSVSSCTYKNNHDCSRNEDIFLACRPSEDHSGCREPRCICIQCGYGTLQQYSRSPRARLLVRGSIPDRWRGVCMCCIYAFIPAPAPLLHAPACWPALLLLTALPPCPDHCSQLPGWAGAQH